MVVGVPSAGGASGNDYYTYNIIKTGDAKAQSCQRCKLRLILRGKDVRK